MDPRLRDLAERAKGFLPPEEGLALYRAGLRAAAEGPLLEVGSYCGKSSVYLGAAAREGGTVLFSLDHHRGSEEHQPGEGYHDPDLTDPETGRLDSLPEFRRTMAHAGLEDVVIGVVGASETVARWWRTPMGLVFIDGGHSREAAHRDYEGWTPRIPLGGFLGIHDVFPDPAEGGRPPYEIYRRALEGGAFEEIDAEGSLRVLRRVAEGAGSA